MEKQEKVEEERKKDLETEQLLQKITQLELLIYSSIISYCWVHIPLAIRL